MQRKHTLQDDVTSIPVKSNYTVKKIKKIKVLLLFQENSLG